MFKLKESCLHETCLHDMLKDMQNTYDNKYICIILTNYRCMYMYYCLILTCVSFFIEFHAHKRFINEIVQDTEVFVYL